MPEEKRKLIYLPRIAQLRSIAYLSDHVLQFEAIVLVKFRRLAIRRFRYHKYDTCTVHMVLVQYIDILSHPQEHWPLDHNSNSMAHWFQASVLMHGP